ncbi:MAG: sensor histidine kinase [Thermoanaerobaculia bacterium]
MESEIAPMQPDLDALWRRVAFLEDVLRCLPAGLIVIDEEGCIAFCNPVADAIRGVGKRLGGPVSECHPRRSQGALATVFEGFRSGETGSQHPLVIERANGWQVSYARVTSPEGRFRGIAWLANDISRQQELQQQLVHQERISGLGRMAAKLGHEVKNPLNIIAGAVHNIRAAGRLDDASREMIDIVENQLARLEALVDHLREVTRPLKVQPRPASVDRIVRDAVGILSSRASIDVALPPSMPKVNVDPALFERLLLNALDNAVRAAGVAGHVSVRVALDTRPEGEWVVLEVNDDGAGIPQSVLDHLFEPFVTTRPDGTGLGLVIMREVCLLHGGELTVSNLPEGGAQVLARLRSR